MRYEVLMLAIPEITVDESEKLETQWRDAIQNSKGTVLSFERWGKYKLSYPVERNEYGVYFLGRFEGPEETVNQLLDSVRALLTLKYSEMVMRFLISRLSTHLPLEYQRPESLEDAPARMTDSLFREHRTDHDSEHSGSRSFRTRTSPEGDM
jgi:small subunit ribosomal protein S6